MLVEIGDNDCSIGDGHDCDIGPVASGSDLSASFASIRFGDFFGTRKLTGWHAERVGKCTHRAR